jgi:hypothetical protein
MVGQFSMPIDIRYSNLSTLGQERSIIDYIAAIEAIPEQSV